MGGHEIEYNFKKENGSEGFMGGYGSGRYGAVPTAEATQSYVLTVASLTRAGIGPGLRGKATYPFDGGEFPVELTIDTRTEGPGFIDFAHQTRSTSDPQPIRYRVWLNWSRPHYGGRRYWFCCLGTGDRATKLFLPLGGHLFLSRCAYRLGYACQRESRSDRLMRNSRKLHRALGGDGEALGQDAPDKPKGMHWRTYERKIARWHAAEDRANDAWLVSMAPLLRRIGAL
jgi:hypothetical protein